MRYGSKGIKMKRIMIFVAFMFLPCVCIALTMCVRDSAMVVSLEPAVAGLSYVADEEEMVWATTFSYGTIYGDATCLSVAPSGTQGVYTNVNGAMLSDGEDLVQRVDGGYCWCRITHPVLSRWVFNYTYQSSSECLLYCAKNCGASAQHGIALRKGLFGSVGK